MIDADSADLCVMFPRLKNISTVKREGAWLASRILEVSKNAGLKPCVEFSGSKGYHFWHFEEAVSAGQAKAVLQILNYG